MLRLLPEEHRLFALQLEQLATYNQLFADCAQDGPVEGLSYG